MTPKQRADAVQAMVYLVGTALNRADRVAVSAIMVLAEALEVPYKEIADGMLAALHGIKDDMGKTEAAGVALQFIGGAGQILEEIAKYRVADQRAADALEKAKKS